MEIQGVDGMTRFAREFLQKAGESAGNGAVVVGLYGDLGAGKTTFVQCVARELGITERVTSPTFVVRKVYILDENYSTFSKLVHIDAYRLETAEDLGVLDWDINLQEEGTLIFVEWADRIEGALPGNTIRLTFTVVDEETRDVTYGKE